MAKVNVDPVELRRFARDLNRFNTDLEDLLGTLHARMQSLEKSWNDQEQRRFMNEFELTLKSLGRFQDTSAQHVSFLMKKAQHVENYLNQR
jgi:uncharacterized protein YukE